MKTVLIILDIVLLLGGVVAYIGFYRICKAHTQRDKVVVPTKKILPYVIALTVIVILVPLIGLGLTLIG